MPTIAVVEGVRIMNHLKDHLPPHLHALIGGSEAQLSIATGEALNGSPPKAKLRVVQSWLAANREQVAYIWREVRDGRDGGVVG